MTHPPRQETSKHFSHQRGGDITYNKEYKDIEMGELSRAVCVSHCHRVQNKILHTFLLESSVKS